MSAPGVLESLVVDEWLFARLNGDATLRTLLGVEVGDRRIASPVAPPAWGEGPFVTFAEASPSSDVRVVGGIRVWGEGLMTIKAVAKTATYSTLRPIAERVDVLLHGATGTTAGGEVIACHREEIVRFVERDEAGGEWRHLGGIYRIVAQ